MKIIAILFPIFSLVVVGYLYARQFKSNFQGVNQATLFIFVPALVFDVMSNKAFHLADYQWLALSGLIVVLGPGLLSWPTAKLLGYPVRAFVPTMMFNNCGNLGLPLAVLAFGDVGLEGAIVLFLVSNVLHFTLGASLFGGNVSIKSAIMNPVSLATIAGLVINFTTFDVPDFVHQPIAMLGQIVIPLMLFLLGARMINVSMDQLKIGVIGGIVRPLIGLISATAAIYFIPLQEFQVGLLLLFAVLPPAVLNFLFAEQYSNHAPMVASLVLVGNAMSIIVIGIVLLFLK